MWFENDIAIAATTCVILSFKFNGLMIDLQRDNFDLTGGLRYAIALLYNYVYTRM
jgi:hypothetical protein